MKFNYSDFASRVRIGAFHVYTSAPSEFSNFADAYVASLLFGSGYTPDGHGFRDTDGKKCRVSASFARMITRNAVWLWEQTRDLYESQAQSERAGSLIGYERIGAGVTLHDGDLPDALADVLAQIVAQLGECDIYTGDNGLIYMVGGKNPRLYGHNDL